MQGSTISAQEIQKLGFPLFSGDADARATGVDSILFVGKGRLFPQDGFQGLILSEIDPPSTFQAGPGVALFKVPAIKAAMAKILPLIDPIAVIFPAGIHPQASVDSSAKIGKNVRIGARAVVQAGAKIGDDVWIGPGAVIEAAAQVGSGCQIHSNAVIGFHCSLGSHCIVHSGTVIGSDGFGFLQSTSSDHLKIPQVGAVIVGDTVEFGANCAIDRGTLGNTIIGSGSKFDNLCHVAHNCKIGKHGLFAGGFFVSGSTVIEDYFTCGGNVAIADHLHITHHVTLGGRAVVTNDITEPGAYTGYPLEPLREGLKTLANLRELTNLRKKINQIVKHLGLKD